MKIAIASDHGGATLKKAIKEYLINEHYEIIDFGVEDDNKSVDYPDYAKSVALSVKNKECDRGILICGTGIGMSIAANKFNDIRCALVHDVFTAKATRQHNDTNIIAMGERVIGIGLAIEIVNQWLNTEFEGDRHINRLAKIKEIENLRK